MMAPMISKWLTAATAAGLMLSLGCGGETGAVVNQDNQRPFDENQYEAPNQVNDTNQLLHVEPCNASSSTCGRTMSVGDVINLRTQLVDADGSPIQNAMISFELEIISGAQGASLSAMRAITDSGGIASVELRSRDDNPAGNLGSLRVTATVDNFDIDPLLFNVGISSKEGGSYIISYSHEGEARPQFVDTLILDPNVSCANATAAFFADNSWPSALTQLPSTQVLPNGDIAQVVYPQVSNNESFTVVGRAIREVGAGRVEVAYGCSDNNPPVELGVDVTVEVELLDHIPFMGSSYDVRHGFDLTDGLPPAVNTVIDLIVTLATDPASFILGCPPGGDACDANGQTGLVDLVIDSGFLGSSTTDTLNSIRNGPLWGLALDYLNGLVEDILPSWWNNTAVAIGDINDMLTEFTVVGRMYFDEQPDIGYNPDGSAFGIMYEQNNRQIWDSIIFQWSQGCDLNSGPNCDQVPVSTDSIGASSTDVIDGNFEATVLGASSLEIKAHPLNLRYGDLIMAVVEQVVLPWVFGDPSVNSLDAAISQLITCDGLADAMNLDPGSFRNAIISLCGQLLDNATQSLRDYVSDNLIASGNDTFRIGTPATIPCTMHQPDIYPSGGWPGDPRPVIDRLGLVGERCEWDTEIQVGNANLTIGGDFYGTIRQQIGQ